jgi:16S rRNA (guanine(966)-N(2))-methyltransferase RsmD
MRIIAGEKRGQKILVPEGIRPMREAVRAALFNILGDLVRGSRFLDLFAGSGSVGLEALSREAKSCVFVDSFPEAARAIRLNLDRLNLKGRGRVYELDFRKAIELFFRRGRRFNLVFIGPPYGKGLANEVLEKIGLVLAEEGIVITEIFKKEELRDEYGNLKLFNERRYGDNLLRFYRKV